MKRYYYVAGLTVLIAITFIVAVPVTYAQSPWLICTARGFPIRPQGAFFERWLLTGGPTGPMGCAVSAVQPGPGGSGQVQQFQSGQIVTSPGQGTNMTVAVYQQGADLVVEWGDTSPFFYDKFIVRWDKNGSNVGQRDVPNGFQRRGVWFVPLPTAGTYSIVIEGCDNSESGSVCHQGWTVPVTITYMPPPPPTVRTNCDFSVSGPILDRWIALGGRDGPLGCPIQNQHNISGTNASTATFSNGQIVWDPDRGTNMTIAAYQVESDIAVEWGPTDPFHYDDFNVLWTKDGIVGPQREVDPYLDANGSPIYPGPNNHGIFSIPGVGPGKYSIQVEGCDKGTFGSTCRQSWTVPVTVELKVLGTSFAGITYNMPQCQGRPPVGGVIGDRWSKLVGSNGPLLGCPTSAEQSIPNTNGRSQDFDNGEIVWSPNQGADLAVALYQQGSELFVDWDHTFPFSYDKFIFMANNAQFDFTPGSGDKINRGHIRIAPSIVLPPPVKDATYSVQLEGCDTGVGGSTCHQGWTVPAKWEFKQPPQPTLPVPDEFAVDFSKLNPATTPADAQTQLLLRGLTIAQSTACTTTLGGADVFGQEEPFALGDVFKHEESFMEAAIAKLYLVSNKMPFCDNPPRPLPLQHEVNSALRFQQIKSKSGSSSPFPCQRTGEYDVALTGYITLVSRFGSLLDNDVRNHIINDLLNLRGPFDKGDLTPCDPALPGPPETENHLNMMESARYLTNQILYAGGGDPLYDNEGNGMNQYMLARLQSYLKNDFIEYNAKPYQTYTDNAIQNLFDFAKDRRVKMAARLVLDYISAKYAVSSNSLRRNAPYRRRPSSYSPWLLDHYADTQNARFTFLSGMFQINDEAIEPDNTQPRNIKDSDDLLSADKHLSLGYREDANMVAVSTYRAPDLILDILMNPDHRKFFQRIHHDGVEIYASRSDYLISAGGYWMGSPYTVMDHSDRDDEGAAVTTTLMPTGHLVNADDMIRFDGYGGESVVSESNGDDADKARNRIQTCVAPDFACGLLPMVPKFYTPPNQTACFQMRDAACAQTQTSSAPWTFIDFATNPLCNNRPIGGFYAAVYREPQSQAWGFFEVHPRDPNLSFQKFVEGVCTRNKTKTFSDSQTNTYVMTSGTTIQFNIPLSTANKYDWPLVSTGNPGLDQLGTDIGQWPLASGEILNSVGHSGIVTFNNPGTGQRLILDFSDFGEPKRTEQ
jgi:hypothetical protein